MPVDLFGYGLREMNLYPYLLWVFYGALLFFSPFWMKTEKRLFTLFLITLVFETAFVIDVGFFIRPSYIIGLFLVIRTAASGLMFPARYTILLALFVLSGIAGIFFNLDLIGAAVSGQTRATFLRPLIQLGQLTMMILIAISVYTNLQRRQYFRHTVRVLHWLSVAVAFSAIYEIAAIYFHLPYLNLNNMLPEYWYPRFGTTALTIFRARVTFIEPIELNNFQMLSIASSLMYRILYHVPWRRYWPFLLAQLVVLVGTFSRSTLLILFVLTPLFFLLYPLRARSTLGFFFKRGVSILVVTLLLFVVHYSVTVTPQELQRANPIVEALLTRRVLHQAATDKLTIFGRARAGEEIQRLVDDGRWAFGFGIGNDANFYGGIGGSNSLYNQVFVYSGIFGASIFLVFLCSLLFGLFRNYMRRSGGSTFRTVQWIFFIGFLGLLTQRLSFSGLLTDTYLWVAFGLVVYLGKTRRLHDFLPE